MILNYDFYKTFVTLAETNNFSKTAKKLNIVQSTVSTRIQELEKYLQTTLFERTNKSVSLTQAGINFLPFAQRIIDIEEEGLNTIHRINYKNTLNIAVVHSLYYRFIKNATKQFMNDNHDTSLKLNINHSNIILEMLSDNLIDIGLVYIKPKSSKLICTATIKDEIILVTKNSKNFSDEITLNELTNLDLLLADLGDGFNEWLNYKLNKKIDYRLYVDQMLEIVNYLKEGFGYAFMLRSLAENLIKTGELKKVTITDISDYAVEGYVVVDKSKLHKKQIASFIKLINEAIDDNFLFQS
jgi:DNA-binding transcriptional LysR family regulator